MGEDAQITPKTTFLPLEMLQPLFTRNFAEGGSVERKPEFKYQLRDYIITRMFCLDNDDKKKKNQRHYHIE